MANWRYHMVCADADQSAALAYMAALGLSGGFGVGLSAGGLAPATHWGQSIQLTQAQSDTLTAGSPPFMWWRCDAARLASQQKLRESNDLDTPGADFGQPFAFADACGVVGVQVISTGP